MDAYFRMMTQLGFFMIKWFFKGVGVLLAAIMNYFRERAHENEVARKTENRPVPAANSTAAPIAQVVTSRPPRLSAEEDAYNVMDDARQARLRYMSVGQNL